MSVNNNEIRPVDVGVETSSSESKVNDLNINELSMQVNREHDACGIFAQIEKSGVPSKAPVIAGIEALAAMRHRAGYVSEEGDGCGLLMDIPRPLWMQLLEQEALAPELVREDSFFVGHLFVDSSAMEAHVEEKLTDTLAEHHLTLLLNRKDAIIPHGLGKQALSKRPHFWQIAGVGKQSTEADLYQAAVALENLDGVHVASLSRHVVVYKVVGDDTALQAYYPDLSDPGVVTRFSLVHTRFSTNTATSFSRVQPFGVLGHNGEINTILRFFVEAGMAGIDMDAGFSDSQMVDRALQALVFQRGWSLFEAVELLLPPIVNEIKHMRRELSDMYMYYRSLWGPFSQGPAGLMMRAGDEAVFAVDALGLRPMWLLETDNAYCFSSEQGIVPPHTWIREPKPLSAGEKIGVTFAENSVTLHEYADLQEMVYTRAKNRYPFQGEGRNIQFAGPYAASNRVLHEGGAVRSAPESKPLPIRAAAFGFREEDYRMLEAMMQTGGEPIQSLGFDSPLAALGENLALVSDFVQETVAVVTNPAIDREREVEHFSTRTVLGRRPSLAGLYSSAPRVEVQAPILIEALPEQYGIEWNEIEVIAHRHGTLCYEDALAQLRTSPNGTAEILIHRANGESVEAALHRFGVEAVEAIQAGANILVLDDRLHFKRGTHIDPYLVTAAVHKALLRKPGKSGDEHLRRRASIVLRSGGLRNLHDIVVAIGLGADAVVPSVLWELAAHRGHVQGIENLYMALTKGLEKVISTLGIHELRGYERLFSGIGIADEVAQVLGVATFCGGQSAGLGFTQIETLATKRQVIYQAEAEKTIPRQKSYQLYPRIWKSAGLVASGMMDYNDYVSKLAQFEAASPINLRHALDFDFVAETDDDVAVDTTIDGHAFPLVISSMSFGSQGETAYRAYAEAAYQMNIVCLNGEGGEIKDLLGKYPRNRGRQIASGRFGVNAELCNQAYILEIKIGQGAKPGEGGHLPASKVTVQVANARNAAVGTDLISPSNNHDIYSIEDLAQVIFELKTVNPYAKVGVKVPVVPNIGTIAVGIAKAGADVITLSGFDGGTGAARAHAIRHVGLPMELGVRLAHDALCESGLRDTVEIWADGGMKSGVDAMKAILLGANRVGFGTMAMVAIGCTSCRACHKDTCHVGIATQMTDKEEALEKGVTSFSPREFVQSVEQLQTFFTAVGQHIKSLTKRLGATRTQDLVGRRDLLKQVQKFDAVDLNWLLSVNESYLGQGTVISATESRTEVTSIISAISSSSLATGTDGIRLQSVDQNSIGLPDSNSSIQSVPRAIGTKESGQAVRAKTYGETRVVTHLGVGGAGFAAYHGVGMVTVAHGGAQDGVGKGSFGGKIVILKTRTNDGVMRGGSVGKGLAYGAQHGLFIVQGNADARAGIRLSGADVIIGGEMEQPIAPGTTYIGAHSNIKGFAFEYMTAGRALVMGDPGPWICAGMTGGTVYLRIDAAMGLTEDALRRRIAKGAKVSLRYLDAQGDADVTELLTTYAKELRRSGQTDAAKALTPLMQRPADFFLMVKPGVDVTDQDIATE